MDNQFKKFLINTFVDSSVVFFTLVVFWFIYGKKSSSDIFFDNEGDLYLFTFMVSAISSICIIKLKEKVIEPMSWLIILVFSGVMCFTTYALSTESFGNIVNIEYNRLILLYLADLIVWGILQYKKNEYLNNQE